MTQILHAHLPAIFISHGSPDTAIADTKAANWMKEFAADLPRPRAIVVVSAHFEVSGGTAVSSAPKPQTIHDFGGFAKELYEIEYRAPGEPELAHKIVADLQAAGFVSQAFDTRGFDHGVWVPLSLIYPDADIPVVSISVDPNEGPAYHYRLGLALADLGRQGVLVIGSGSFTHNLGEAFKYLRSDADRTMKMEDWVRDFTLWMAENLTADDLDALLDYRAQAPFAVKNHPTDEHLLPLYVALGAGGAGAHASLMHESADYGVLSMSMWRFDPTASFLPAPELVLKGP